MENNWTPEAIKELRAQLDMSQTVFAALFPVNYHSVMRWENGKHAPTRQAIKRLNELKEGILEKMG